MTMGERLSSTFSTVFTVIGGFFTLASFILQRAPPVFLGVNFGSPSQEAIALRRLARQGRINILVRQLESGYWAPGRHLDLAEKNQLTDEIKRLLEREEADAGAEEAKEAEVVAWGRYCARKLGNTKQIFTLPRTQFGARIAAKCSSYNLRIRAWAAWLNPWRKAEVQSQGPFGLWFQTRHNGAWSGPSNHYTGQWRDESAVELQQISPAAG